MDRYAFDRATVRSVDADGRLHVERSHISKAAVNPYYGREIPGYQALGLDADKVYRLFRDPVELEKGAATFARLPILKEHVPVTVDSPQPDLVIGAIGSDVAFNSPYLDADLCFWDATAIAGIETGSVTELSSAYRYDPIMEPGEYEGQAYDGKMTNIRGNHLALVEVGRAGSDVVVADHNPFVNRKETAMKMTKLGKALFVAICAASPVLAQDSATPTILGEASRKNFDKADVKAKLLALDAAIDSNQLDSILDAILDVEQSPEPVEPPVTEAEDDGEGSPVEKLRALLAGKVDDETINAACSLLSPAVDEDPDEKDKDMKEDKKLEAAMDGFKRNFRAAEEARRDVRPVVGDVLGMDSAAEIYGFALDHMKVAREGVEGAPALKALFKLAATKSAPAPVPAVTVAQDAASAVTVLPALARFRQA